MSGVPVQLASPYERGVALREQCEPGTLLCGHGFKGTVEVVSVTTSTIFTRYSGGITPWSMYDAGMDLFLASETVTP